MDSIIQIVAHCQSDVGLLRKQNEDICSVCPQFQYFFVADGIGGALGGDMAGSIFLDVVSETLINSCNMTPEENISRIRTCFTTANKRIHDYVSDNPAYKGMGCTAELLIICGDEFILGHIGDSRTYSFYNNKLEQITEDHTLVQEQLKQGAMTKHQAKKSRLSNVLSRAVGVGPQVQFDIHRGKVVPGTLFILCTDGLHSMVPPQKIPPVLQYDAPLALKTEMLISMANNAGGRDNVTIALIEVVEQQPTA